MEVTLDINVPERIKKNRDMSLVINVEYDLRQFSEIEYVSVLEMSQQWTKQTMMAVLKQIWKKY